MSSNKLMRQADLISELVYQKSMAACRNQVLIFARMIKNKLIENGIGKQVAAESVKQGFEGYLNLSTFKQECLNGVNEVLNIYLQPNNRGRDVLGRLMTEYCFVRRPSGQVLFPDESEKDDESRVEYMPGVLPRPLLKYFLVSVRGSIEGVDGFRFMPMLFGFDDPLMEERHQTAFKLLESFRTMHDGGKRVTDWNGMYQHQVSKQLTRHLAAEVLKKVHDLGRQRLLNILNNIQYKDESVSEEPALKRVVVAGDVDLIIACLEEGIGSLG